MNIKNALHVVSLLGLFAVSNAGWGVIAAKDSGAQPHGILVTTEKPRTSVVIKQEAKAASDDMSSFFAEESKLLDKHFKNLKARADSMLESVKSSVSSSVSKARETTFVSRVEGTSQVERAGITSDGKYRIERALPGFDPSEISIDLHQHGTKAWIEIKADRKARVAKLAHGFQESFFKESSKTIERTLPSFVRTNKKFTKWVGDGLVTVEFEIDRDAQLNPNLLALDTERVHTTP